MTKLAEKRALAGIDQPGRVAADLAVEVRLKERVLRAEDGVPLRTEAGELGGQADGGAPVLRRDQVEKEGQLGLHGAADKGTAWKLKGIDR